MGIWGEVDSCDRGLDEANICCFECIMNLLDILSDNSLNNKHNTENKQPKGRVKPWAKRWSFNLCDGLLLSW